MGCAPVFAPSPVILIASAAPERLVAWEQALTGMSAGVVAVRQFEWLKQALPRVRPRVLLLDLGLPGLDGPRGVATLHRTSPTTRIIVLSDAASDEVEVALFKLGVRGCTRHDVDPQLLKRIVVAVEQGELWIRRLITPRVLDELAARSAANAAHTSREELALLTEREREIVKLIASGESNKHIARELCISERTVKAHLTEIYRKLGVTDRVRLALRVAAQSEYRSEQTAS